MGFRQYIAVVRDRARFIVQLVVLLAVVAAVASSLRTPTYQATARILLRPDDPAEQLNPVQGVPRDANRYVEAQKEIITSQPVAQEAASSLHGVSAGEIGRHVSVRDGDQSDVIKISARDTDPARARDMANAVANGYIENRRRSAVAGLERAAKELQDKLVPLQAAIAELDQRVASLGGNQGASSELQQPVRPATPPTTPVPTLDPGLSSASLPTSSEALKAARYAYAVQYETLFARQQELMVDISLKRGEAELIAEAKMPTVPVSPRPVRDTAVGAFVGLLVGVGITLLRDQFDDRLRSVEDLEQVTRLPVLAQLPFDQEALANPAEVTAIARPQSSLSEGARALRTSIEYLGIDNPVKVIIVTSALPGEGKSVVAANLAVVCAHAGYRTVLVAADLRRSGVSRFFNVSASSPGLSSVVAQFSRNGELRQPIAVKEQATNGHLSSLRTASASGPTVQTVASVVRHPVTNLSFVPAGPTPPNPAELLGSRRMRQVLAEIRDSHDVVVIDTPPLLPVTDAAVLMGQCDGVVLVTAVGETPRDAAVRAKTILEGTSARVLGVVANKVADSKSSYYYGGYYSEKPDSDGATGRRRFGRRRGRHRRKGGAAPAPAADAERTLQGVGEVSRRQKTPDQSMRSNGSRTSISARKSSTA